MAIPRSRNWPGRLTGTGRTIDIATVYYCTGQCSALSRPCQAQRIVRPVDSKPSEQEKPMKRCAFLVAFAMLAGSPSIADNMSVPVNADGLKWGPAPPAFPKGAQIAVLSGDPFKEGLYVVRLKMPGNYKIPAHNHPTSEYVTIVSGTFHIG